MPGRLRREAHRAVLAVRPAGDDVADDAVVDLANGLGQRRGVTAHQPAGDLEVLLVRLLAGLEDAAHARAVDGHRLLHEHVAALAHRVLHVERPEARRRGQDHHADPLQGVDRLLVGVKADELAVLGHVDLLAELVGEVA